VSTARKLETESEIPPRGASLSLVTSPGKPVFEKLVWKITDVMEALDCSERHVRDLVAEDRIPFAKAGRLIRFHRDRVLEWLAKGGTR
jgi:excisionase family DNA binding protein